jgi:hypothetical protein
MRPRPILVALAALALVLPSVAAGFRSVEAKLASLSIARYRATVAHCNKVGLMLFIEHREFVYDCRLSGVDLAHRASLPSDQLKKLAVDTCWVYTGGIAYEVSHELALIARAGGARLPCA